MKKRTLALLLGVVMAFGLAACGGGESAADAGANTDAEQPETEEAAGLPSEGEVSNYYISLTGCSFGNDYDGNPIIVVNYDFTNNGEEATSALVGIYMQAFQDGVELDTAFVMDSSVYDAGIAQKDIKPGTTLENCQSAYVLTSDSPVEIEVSDIFNDPTVGATYEVVQ